MAEATQVAIVGAGPAGLLLGHLRTRAGIERLQRAQLEYLFSSRAAAAGLAENYVGMA